jgi:hypothetical protein
MGRDAHGTCGTGEGRPPVAPTFAVINGAPTEHGAGRDTVTQGVALGYINIAPLGLGSRPEGPNADGASAPRGDGGKSSQLRITN